MSRKKLIFSVLIICAMFLTACFAETEEDAEDLADPEEVAEEADYTLLVYMVGSDLESDDAAASADLEEMLAVQEGSNVNVIVQTGGAASWEREEISDSIEDDVSINTRWDVYQGELTELKNVGRRNMGNPETLSNFLIWSAQHYPAKNYSLVFWDHGGGSLNGFGYDENYVDMLSLPEMEQALLSASEETGVTFDVIGFDACLMATAEVAYALEPYANYLVASEEVEPGHGWDYTPIIRSIMEDPAITGDSLGQIIADGYQKQAYDQETEADITLSVIQLDMIPAVVDAWNTMIADLNGQITVDRQLLNISKARGRSETYGETSDSSTDLVDIIDLAVHLELVGGDRYEANAEALIDALQNAVIYQVYGELRPNAYGMSIYFPYRDKDNFENNLIAYQELNFPQPAKDFASSYATSLKERNIPVRYADVQPDRSEDKGKSSYSVRVAKDDVEKVQEAYSLLAQTSPDNPDEVWWLGFDSDVEFDEDTGEILNEFDGGWVTLDGHFVSLTLLDEDEEQTYSTYSIPCKVNGEEGEIEVYIDYLENTYEFLGFWKGMDEETGMADRDMRELVEGDKIIPMYEFFNIETDEEGYRDGDEFTYTDASELNYEDLPEGEYMYGFYLIDAYQNDSTSDFDIFDIDNEGNIVNNS